MTPTSEISSDALQAFVTSAKQVGFLLFLPFMPDLSGLMAAP